MIELPPSYAFKFYHRLDIVLRFLCVKESFLGGLGEASPYRRMYRRFIQYQLDNSRYKVNTHQRCVDDFDRNFCSLIESMKKSGFDLHSPVVLGSDGSPFDGAHRLACSAALGCRSYGVYNRAKRVADRVPSLKACLASDEFSLLHQEWLKHNRTA